MKSAPGTVFAWGARGVALVVALFAAIVAVASLGSFPQPQDYHAFADARAWLGVANFANVASNLAFVLVGIAGLREIARRPPGLLPELRGAYAAFFAGSLLIAIGSSTYHLRPTDATLVWDRLPMTLSFMAFVTIVAGEYLDARRAMRALPILVAIGLGSVAWWRIAGDLRPYLVVQ